MIVRVEDNGSGELSCVLESPICVDSMEAVNCAVDYLVERCSEDSGEEQLTPEEAEQLRREICSQVNQGYDFFDTDNYPALKKYSYCMTLTIHEVAISETIIRKIQTLKSPNVKIESSPDDNSEEPHDAP